jgi:hypothetical protein
MNRNNKNRNLELDIEKLAMTLEVLEEYIDRGEYFSDWKQRKQFYNRTIPIGEMVSWEVEEDFAFSQFSVFFYLALKGEPKEHRQKIQKEFYK